jgi:hypothetical protein
MRSIVSMANGWLPVLAVGQYRSTTGASAAYGAMRPVARQSQAESELLRGCNRRPF